MNDRITETKEEARQGETTAPMAKVLVISAGSAFIILMIIVLVFAL